MTAKLIDDEVRKLVEEAYGRTIDILTRHQKELTELATVLLKKEVVEREELEQIFGVPPMIKTKLERV